MKQFKATLDGSIDMQEYTTKRSNIKAIARNTKLTVRNIK